MSDFRWTLGAVGDVFLNRPDPHRAFDRVGPVLKDVDLLFGNCEGVYTDDPRSVPTASGFRLISGSSNAEALGPAGFHVMSCANNHTVDAGHEGLADTLDCLRAQGIRTAGAGGNAIEARRPAILEIQGLRVAVLAFTAVYPAGYEARERSAGVAAMRVHTHYFVHPEAFGRVEPGADPQIGTFPFPGDLALLADSIRAAKACADMVVVSFHWGKSTRPALLTDYEKAYGHAAIDAGCDAVLGHHHHLLRGIELYCGKPIFYGLGHFAFDMPGLEQALGEEQLRRLHAFGEYAIYPREGYPRLPFHPDSRMTMVGLCRFDGRDLAEVCFVPCLINRDNQPEPLALDEERGRRVVDYVRAITQHADLPTAYGEGGTAVGGYRTVAVNKGLSGA